MAHSYNHEEVLIKAKKRLLKMHYESGVGHIGGNLSALDVMLTLHHNIMNKDDIFILSKGHAAGVLYVTLWTLGKIDENDLTQFHKNGTKLSGHPPPLWISDIPVATGSLGHGLPVATGIALSNKLNKKSRHVYCLTSDGEWQEGSNWEALILANHNNLTNLTILIDANGLQGFGTVEAVASLTPLKDKFKAFGCTTFEIDGHDFQSIKDVFLEEFSSVRVILLKTIKGKGVSFMENKLEWHYLSMNEAQYKRAIEDIS